MNLIDKLQPKRPDEIAFAPVQEPLAIYRLEDGTVVRVRIMLVKVFKTDQLDAEGKPVYQCKMQQVLDVEPPQGEG